MLVGDETDPASSTTTINVDQYATYGIGLYRVDATATSISGQSCRVSALVKVVGNPETTVAGGAATGAEVLALLGIAGAGVRAANPGEAGTGTDTPTTPTIPTTRAACRRTRPRRTRRCRQWTGWRRA